MSVAVASRAYGLALDEAAQLVQLGWTQGAYYRYEGGTLRRCDLAYALQEGAVRHGLDPEELRRLVLRHLDEPYRSDEDYGLERWNDTNYRSRSEVLILLERVREGLA